MNNRKHLNKEKHKRTNHEVKTDWLIFIGVSLLLVGVTLIGVLAGIPCSL